MHPTNDDNWTPKVLGISVGAILLIVLTGLVASVIVRSSEAIKITDGDKCVVIPRDLLEIRQGAGGSIVQ